MKALLLGFGDIAQRTSELLLAKGWNLTGVRRSEKQMAGVEVVRGDCTDEVMLARMLPDYDVVIASFTPDEYSESGYRAAYLNTAEALAKVMKNPADRPGRLIWVSSTSVFGSGDGDWVDEQTPPQPTRYSGEILLEAEQRLHNSGAPVTVVRFSGIYGRGAPRLIEQVKAGRCVPDQPVVWSNRIHGDDCAGFLAHLCQKAVSREELESLYLATDCEPVPLHQVHKWIADQLGLDMVEEGKPGSLRGNRRCSNKRMLATGYRFKYSNFREGYLPFIK